MQNFKSNNKQKGALAILMAFIIGIGVITYLVQSLDPQRLRAEQDAKTMRALNDAKKALIAWSVSHQHTPGQMPWPDRHIDPGIYDGSSDCSTAVFQYSNLLGQLPSLPDTSPCLDKNTGLSVYAGLSTYPSLGQEFRDAQGNRLWYAVSRNLVRNYAAPASDPVINPNIINAPTYQWLQVLDRNGNLISNRVAAVIIAPGDPLDGQNRAGAADATQFLDRFQIGAAVFNNRGYATDDEDFIMGEDSRNVSENDPTYVQPYLFNDKLVYITIDELMAALEKRVGEQVRSSLKTYQDTNDYYPYAAHLGTSLSYVTDGNLTKGFLPIFQNCEYKNLPLSTSISTTRVAGSNNLTTAASFSLVSKGWLVVGAGIPSGTTISSVINTTTLTLSSSATSSGTSLFTFIEPKLGCTQPLFDVASTALSAITGVRFYLPSGTFTSSTGGCTRQSGNTRCYCTSAGASSCSNASTTFRCELSGCFVTGLGATGEVRIVGGKLTSATGGCQITTAITKNVLTDCPVTTTNRITCNTDDGLFASHSNTDARIDGFLPSWFNQNQWFNYVYYEMTRPIIPNVGITLIGKPQPAEAMITTVGRPLNNPPFAISRGAAQVRPSCNAINNYLDSVENADLDSVFDASSTQRRLNYNDQTFVVAP